MELKRVYDIPEGWVKKVNEEIPLVVDGKPVLDRGVQVMTLVDPTKEKGACLNPPPVRGVEVRRAGPRQKFSPEQLATGAKIGYLSMADGHVTLKAENVTLVYKIVRTPGFYCSHCGEEQPDGKTAAAHVARVHPGKKSPDRNNPAGYERLNAFDCALVEE